MTRSPHSPHTEGADEIPARADSVQTLTNNGDPAMVTDPSDRNRESRRLQRTLELLRAANRRLDFEKQLNQKIIETSPVEIGRAHV